MTRLPTAVATATWAMTLWLPRSAGACPACAGQTGGGSARLVVVAIMIVFPFVATWAVVVRLKRLLAQHSSERDAPWAE